MSLMVNIEFDRDNYRPEVLFLTSFSYGKEENNSANKIQKPLRYSKDQRLEPILQYYGSNYIEADSLTRLCLYLTNKTDSRIEGWLTLKPPVEVTIEPGDLLMIAVRPKGTIPVEFYISAPKNLNWRSYILSLEIESRSGYTQKSDFDLSEHVERC